MERSLTVKNKIALEPQAIFYVFYAVNLIFLLGRFKTFYTGDFAYVATTDRFPFRWIPDDFKDLNFYLQFISISGMVLLVLSFLFLHLQWTRILWFIINIVLVGFDYAADNGHNAHLFLWIALFFCLKRGSINAHNTDREWHIVFRAAQLQILLVYGLAGLWKVNSVYESFFDSNIVTGFDYFAYAMSQEYINSNIESAVATFFAEQRSLSAIFSIFMIGIQVGSLFVVLIPRLYPLWGVFIGLFHIGTLAVINVIFLWPIILALLFLCFYKHEDGHVDL